MRLSRLIAYSAMGIIAGLLLENKLLSVGLRSARKARLAKKKVDDIIYKKQLQPRIPKAV
jgi:hypothetical protein